ncbi:Std1p KNAG_0B03000 [Huiozyma naganishii CBS 8797]|uniref:Uncharacterized protein n=1 Tax=Huiozyma naganishii (strain ATCC MYA-139 / BCRC 22969 / CBS 8797 / KCTC 17520 / NBRC 10181 / NCYC 3082 / Yp74L-3) TaxID=1071383 RepID=J7RV21_HUIN7|nr:hypothetical protein KNAG_0B03000 [Kazachstania naganishii CBS 8797]CCK68742.1 hypothetical protein KNAG_0B03000 [Kazachstania naganishii CBS 8797]
MFVSPPPATLMSQVLQRKHSKKNSDTQSNNIGLQPIVEENNSEHSIMTGAPSMYDPTALQQQQLNKNGTDFVSAPPEYADRARSEIRKRLLPPNSNNVRSARSSSHTSSRSVTSRNTNDRASIDHRSLASDDASSYQSSIFSHPSTMFTQSSGDIGLTPVSTCEITTAKFITHVTLEEALPKTFFDMYTAEVLMSDPTTVLPNGRPSFTKRELLDWDLNDIRSLLIVEKSRPEWGSQLPEVTTSGPNLPQFRLQLLPLNATDNCIITTLVSSDLYLEAHLDYEFKLTSAKYTVAAARKRHEQMTGRNEAVMHLSKPEWRNIIENYLLNVAVEAQCRFDFKQRCSEYRKWKLQQSNLKRPDMPPPKMIPSRKAMQNNLLKMTLMKNLHNSSQQANSSATTQGEMNEFHNDQGQKISLTPEEKANIWAHCQTQVYQRLGLDWKPDCVK